MAPVRQLAVNATRPAGDVSSRGREAETIRVSPNYKRNRTVGVATTHGAPSPTAKKRQRGPGRGTTGGPAGMAICNAVTAALKHSCGKGPTKVKAYSTHDHV